MLKISRANCIVLSLAISAQFTFRMCAPLRPAPAPAPWYETSNFKEQRRGTNRLQPSFSTYNAHRTIARPTGTFCIGNQNRIFISSSLKFRLQFTYTL